MKILFTLALKWWSIITLSFVPSNDMMEHGFILVWSFDIFGGEQWQFCFTYTDMMGKNAVFVCSLHHNYWGRPWYYIIVNNDNLGVSNREMNGKDDTWNCSMQCIFGFIYIFNRNLSSYDGEIDIFIRS